MTSSDWANPYGVRKPYGSNGANHGDGGEKGATLSADHPLVPWKQPDHVHQWVDVDHSREELDRFVRNWPDLGELLDANVGHGRVVIVSGPPGMGKTTLIHRCLYEVQQRVAATGPSAGDPLAVFVPTAGLENDGRRISVDPDGSFAPTRLINARIRSEITKKLLLHEFSESRVRAITAEEDPYQAYGEMSDLLVQRNALLFAVIPHIRWNDAHLRAAFLRTCLSHAHTRIVLFVEVSHGAAETAREVAAALSGSAAVTHLALRELNSEDIWRFSRSARAANGAPNGLVEPDRSSLMAAHDEWKPSDVRELRKVFHSAADALRRAPHPWPIDADALRPHWERRRAGRDALLRHPILPRSGG
ncbi:ATP-binding protein [Streptomyces lomondensis]|nr:ATP-binding protein [Streptomyces lomondensis]MCF0079997.1 ATP-binding protein [Streptomyces lomondensis]